MSRCFFPALCLDQRSWVLHNNNNSHRIAVLSPKTLESLHQPPFVHLNLCTATTDFTLYSEIAGHYSTLPEFLRVFITLLEAETTSLPNACLLLLQMAGKSWREVGVESLSCNVKSSGGYPSGNKLFTLKTHKPLSIHLKATKNPQHHACVESLPGPRPGLI